MLKSLSKLLFPALLSFVFITTPAFAHSVVSPANTDTSKYETFTLSVPTEKDVPTTDMRLLIPSSLESVTPYVKPGWDINVTKENDKVTQIEWTGGPIPPQEKDVFMFTAATPAKNTTLIWKAYQTYQDGEVVAWDQDPKSGANGIKANNPYSTTKVVSSASKVEPTSDNGTPKKVYLFSILALIISVLALCVGLSNSKLRNLK